MIASFRSLGISQQRIDSQPSFDKILYNLSSATEQGSGLYRNSALMQA